MKAYGFIDRLKEFPRVLNSKSNLIKNSKILLVRGWKNYKFNHYFRYSIRTDN